LIEGKGGLDGECLFHKYFHELVALIDAAILFNLILLIPLVPFFFGSFQVVGEELCHSSDFIG
jgi:hypothetical protein